MNNSRNVWLGAVSTVFLTVYRRWLSHKSACSFGAVHGTHTIRLCISTARFLWLPIGLVVFKSGSHGHWTAMFYESCIPYYTAVLLMAHGILPVSIYSLVENYLLTGFLYVHSFCLRCVSREQQLLIFNFKV